MQILTNITILDFTRLLPGPLATNMLAQMGARVIKIEQPDRGDYARMQPPFVDGESTLFGALNFAKEVRKVDFKSKTGKKKVMELAQEADMVIEQFRPGVMAACGLGYEDFKTVNEQIIYLSLSGYGQDGPYRDKAGHDLNYLAYSGILSLTQDREGRPVIPGVQVADISGGSYMLLTACLTALLNRERSGRGSYVDVSMLDGLLPLLTVPATQQWGGFDPYQMNFLSRALVNYNVYQCSDGKWIALGALELKFWNNFCDLVDRPEWKRQNHLELSIHAFPVKEVEELFQSKKQSEWLDLAEGKDICLSPVRRLEEIGDDPQIRHRGGILNVKTPAGNEMRSFALPFRLQENALEEASGNRKADKTT